MGKKYYKKKIIEKYKELTAEDATELLKNMDAVIDKSFKKYKNKPQDELKQRKKHMKRVTLIALKLVELKSVELKSVELENSQIKNLLIAAYLHDIKKYDKEHQKVGAKYIKDNMKHISKKMNKDTKRTKLIGKYIKKHSKSSGNKDIVLQILQDADKLEKMCRRYKRLDELLLGE